MGDRAYVRITCRREDVGRFEEIGFVEDDAESDVAVFFGWHDAGFEYDGSMFASDGSGEYREVLSTPNESLALVRVMPDGTIAERDLDCVREYYSALAVARADLGITEAG